jgi:hypothetical protein
MTHDEVLLILRRLMVGLPHIKTPPEATLQFYAEKLSCFSEPALRAAVEQWIETGKPRLPTVSELRDVAGRRMRDLETIAKLPEYVDPRDLDELCPDDLRGPNGRRGMPNAEFRRARTEQVERFEARFGTYVPPAGKRWAL